MLSTRDVSEISSTENEQRTLETYWKQKTRRRHCSTSSWSEDPGNAASLCVVIKHLRCCCCCWRARIPVRMFNCRERKNRCQETAMSHCNCPLFVVVCWRAFSNGWNSCRTERDCPRRWRMMQGIRPDTKSVLQNVDEEERKLVALIVAIARRMRSTGKYYARRMYLQKNTLQHWNVSELLCSEHHSWEEYAWTEQVVEEKLLQSANV